MEGLIRVTPNRSKAASMLKMAKTTLEMVRAIDMKRFPSNVVKEYYEIMHELIAAILLIDGFKTYGEGAHALAIEYIAKNCREFNSFEISMIDDMRDKRNKITYDGFFVDEEYVSRRKGMAEDIIRKLVTVLEKKM